MTTARVTARATSGASGRTRPESGSFDDELSLHAVGLVTVDWAVELVGAAAEPRPHPHPRARLGDRTLPDESHRASAIAALEGLGYRHYGQVGVPGRDYLTSRRPLDGTPVNVHVFAAQNPLLTDNRIIRDFLRAQPDAAREYIRSKEKALEQGHADLLSYSHAKGQQVAAIREAAYDWAQRAEE
jgi:hypothetical protein